MAFGAEGSEIAVDFLFFPVLISVISEHEEAEFILRFSLDIALSESVAVGTECRPELLVPASWADNARRMISGQIDVVISFSNYFVLFMSHSSAQDCCTCLCSTTHRQILV